MSKANGFEKQRQPNEAKKTGHAATPCPVGSTA
jgi:hypothetical protein